MSTVKQHRRDGIEVPAGPQPAGSGGAASRIAERQARADALQSAMAEAVATGMSDDSVEFVDHSEQDGGQ
jgi:uncharacterized protein YciI